MSTAVLGALDLQGVLILNRPETIDGAAVVGIVQIAP
jgi:hypothetical protein